MKFRQIAILAVVVGTWSIADSARANPRPLPFSYPLTLPAGAFEIEQYADLTPVRVEREDPDGTRAVIGSSRARCSRRCRSSCASTTPMATSGPAITRRQLLRAMAGTALALPFGGLGCGAPERPRGWIVGASDRDDGRHFLSAVNLETLEARDVEVPVRGHAAAMHPRSHEVALVARRPGTTLAVVDLAQRRLIHTIASPTERHFLGHALYDRAGGYLYATENVVDEGALPDLTPRNSVIGIYDVAAGYRRIGELPTHGVGAHELALAADGETLVVANGGIYTHPSRPRDKLNVDTMDPSLAWISLGSGELVRIRRPAHAQLSVRHLAIAPDGSVVTGMQYEGPRQDRVALVAVQRGAGELEPLAAPGAIYRGLDRYVGSIAVSGPDGVALASSPRGGRIEAWALSDDTYLGGFDAADACGLGSADDAIVATSGGGDIYGIDGDTGAPAWHARRDGVRWDNHLLATAALY